MLGEFVLPRDGSVWTSTIIDGLAVLGVGERNARQAAARLSDQGLVDSERIGRAARWSLTPEGRRLLEAGTRRIYELGARSDGWDGHWLVVLASVPEDERAKRHRLRSRLGFLGFGFLAPGVAVSPHLDREPAADDVLHELELDDTAVVFVARTGTFVPDETIIARAWDLDGLAQDYRDFVAQFERLRPDSPRDAFGAVVSLVHEWRRFPFVDPEIPAELLPSDWPGHEAKSTFDRLRGRWAPSANSWYSALAEESSTAG
jgi:phenylacetic acid degradation operon negative regulatory protein